MIQGSPLFFLFLTGWLFGGEHAFSAQLSDEAQRILQVRLVDGLVTSPGIIGFQTAARWYLPLSEFAQSLGILIETREGMRAEGFVLAETRTFKLDHGVCAVQLSGRRAPYVCDRVATVDQELYVETALLEEWLPVKIQIDPLKSEVVIIPIEVLPVQSRRDRDNLLVGQNRQESFDVGRSLPQLKGQSPWVSGPKLDQQLSWTQAGRPSGIEREFSDDISAGWEALGVDGYLHWKGSTRTSSPLRLTFSKKDPDGNVFGILHATEVQGFDVDMPAMTLVTPGSLQRGVYVTNAPLEQTTTLTTQDFQGNLLPGWEVELYQNEMLIDRQTPDPQGRYNFKAVPLTRGINRFMLAFYGPFGQRHDIHYTYQLGANLLRAREIVYKAALATESGTPVYSLLVNRGVSRNLSLAAGSSRIYLKALKKSKIYGHFDVAGFADSVLFSASGATSGGESSAGEFGLRFPYRGISLGTKATLLKNFVSDLFNSRPSVRKQLSQLDSDLSFVLPSTWLTPSVGSTFGFVRREFEEKQIENSLKNRVSFSTGPIYWNHEFNYEFENTDDPWNGRADSMFILARDRYRLTLSYKSKSLEYGEAEGQLALSDKLNTTLSVRRRIQEQVWQGGLGVNHRFQYFNSGLQADYSTAHEYSVGANLAFAVLPGDPSTGIAVVPGPVVNTGAIAISVFIDEDRDGFRGANEVGVSQAEVLISQISDPVVCDRNGRAFVPSVQPYMRTAVMISGKSVDDMSLRPAIPGVRVIPRPGQVLAVSIPFVRVGMIDGVIEYVGRSSRRPIRGLSVELQSLDGKQVIAQTKTDSEGFYWFEDVAPGKYRLHPVRRGAQGGVVPESRTIEVPKEGGILSGENFTSPMP